jgi:hypothetical protein
MHDKDRYAGRGQVWVCGACGKIAETDRTGQEGTVSPMWDESCFLNAVLCKQGSIKTSAGGRVTHAEACEPDVTKAER